MRESTSESMRQEASPSSAGTSSESSPGVSVNIPGSTPEETADEQNKNKQTKLNDIKTNFTKVQAGIKKQTRVMEEESGEVATSSVMFKLYNHAIETNAYIAQLGDIIMSLANQSWKIMILNLHQVFLPSTAFVPLQR